MFHIRQDSLLTGFYSIGLGGKSVALCFELYTSIIIPSINI